MNSDPSAGVRRDTFQGVAGEAGARLRRHLPLIAVLALVAPVYFAWTWTDQMGEFANDGPNYLMMARHFANPGDHGVGAQVAAVSRFPPLYPLLLAWTGAAGELHAVHAVSTAGFMLALVALYAWLCGEGFSAMQGAAAVLLFAALPQSWLLGLTVQSEYLYLFWSLLALALLAAYRARGRTELLYVAALAVAAAALTRMFGVALLLPLALAAVRAPARSAALALAIAVAPLATWNLLHRAAHSYQAELYQIYGAAPLRHLIGQVGRELPALQGAFLENFGGVQALSLPVGAFGLVCVAAALWRAVRLKPDATYLAAYAAILLVWPFPEEATRFLWVIVPVLAVQPVLALADWRRQAAAAPVPRGATAVLAALVAVAVAPGLLRAALRFDLGAHCPWPAARTYTSWYKPDFADALEEVNAEIVMTRDLRLIEAKIPPQDCVIAVRPDLVSFYTSRRAAQVPLNSVPNPEFQRRLRASGCPFVFMSTRTDAAYPDALHPVSRLGDDIEVLYYNAVPNPPGSTHFIISMLARLK